MNILAALLGLVLACGASFWYGVTVGDDHATAAVARENRIAQVARDAGQRGAAEAIAKNRPRNVTIRQETEREIQSNTVYAECRHSPEQLRRINDAIAGRGSEPAGSGLVPRNAPLVSGRLWGDDGQADRLRDPVLGVP